MPRFTFHDLSPSDAGVEEISTPAFPWNFAGVGEAYRNEPKCSLCNSAIPSVFTFGRFESRESLIPKSAEDFTRFIDQFPPTTTMLQAIFNNPTIVIMLGVTSTDNFICWNCVTSHITSLQTLLQKGV